MKKLIVLVSLFSVGLFAELTENERKQKQLSLFTVVTFPNAECQSQTDPTILGTCMTTTECNDNDGQIDGNCAAGFGSCCLFRKSTCGDTITQNSTYIRNPSFPTRFTTAGACSFTIKPLNDAICQLRLDFINHDTTDVAATGVCTDTTVVTGPTGKNPPTVCGTLTGQHMYVENGRRTTDTTLAVTIGTGGGGTWDIKVTQIECNCPNRVETDCSQWLTGTSGSFSSFNWPNGQLLSQDMTYCVRREEGYCGIQYFQASPMTAPNSFMLANAANLATAFIGPAAAAAINHGIIVVEGDVSLGDTYGGVLLGGDVAGAITDTQSSAVFAASTGNFRVRYFTQTAALPAANQNTLGFKLNYAQVPCGVPTTGGTTTV